MNAPWKPGSSNGRDPFNAYICDDNSLDVLRPVGGGGAAPGPRRLPQPQRTGTASAARRASMRASTKADIPRARAFGMARKGRRAITVGRVVSLPASRGHHGVESASSGAGTTPMVVVLARTAASTPAGVSRREAAPHDEPTRHKERKSLLPIGL